MESQTTMSSSSPDYVLNLKKSFGEPSQSAFGSAVFFVPAAEQSQSLEIDALSKYRYFIGDAWDRLGEKNWMDGWSSVYVREQGSSRGILVELKSLTDRETRQSAGLLLENTENTDASSQALRAAFDSTLITELRIFKIGDCSALSGVLIAARLLDSGSLFLALLMD